MLHTFTDLESDIVPVWKGTARLVFDRSPKEIKQKRKSPRIFHHLSGGKEYGGSVVIIVV
jgi:hypothetical protein